MIEKYGIHYLLNVSSRFIVPLLVQPDWNPSIFKSFFFHSTGAYRSLDQTFVHYI
jgi:hypothetical protein